MEIPLSDLNSVTYVAYLRDATLALDPINRTMFENNYFRQNKLSKCSLKYGIISVVHHYNEYGPAIGGSHCSNKDKWSLSLKTRPLFFLNIEPYRSLRSKSGEECIFYAEIQYFRQMEAYGMASMNQRVKWKKRRKWATFKNNLQKRLTGFGVYVKKFESRVKRRGSEAEAAGTFAHLFSIPSSPHSHQYGSVSTPRLSDQKHSRSTFFGDGGIRICQNDFFHGWVHARTGNPYSID